MNGGGEAVPRTTFLSYSIKECTNIISSELRLVCIKNEKDFFLNGTISCHNRKDFTGATLYAALHVNEQMPIISRVLLSIFLACSLLFVLCRIFSVDDILF